MTALAALGYAAVFYRVYLDYLHPVFEYAHYNLVARDAGMSVATFFIATAPALFNSRFLSPASIICSLIYCLYYVPSVFVMMLSSSRPSGEVLGVQFALMTAMIILFAAGHLRWSHSAPRLLTKLPPRIIEILTVLFVLIVVITYYDHMQLVAFEDVYDLRFETNQIAKAPMVGHIVMWLSYCLLPYSFARGLIYKETFGIALGVAGSLIIYMATGSKAAILMPVIMLSLMLIMKFKGDFLAKLLWALILTSLVLMYAVPDDGAFGWMKSLLFQRTLGSGGWTTYVYYDHFTAQGLTYLSHIRFVDALTGIYPYGQLQLGQVIGLQYSGSELANFNAGFWASDGIAAFGTAGIYFISVILFVFLVLLNRISAIYDPSFIGLWLSGFAMALLNIPLGTAIVSGGGGLAIVMMVVFNIAKRNYRNISMQRYGHTMT